MDEIQMLMRRAQAQRNRQQRAAIRTTAKRRARPAPKRCQIIILANYMRRRGRSRR